MQGSIKRLSKGRYKLRWDHDTDTPGVRRQRSVTFYGSREQAEAELDRLVSAARGGRDLEEDPTFEEFAGRWLLDHAAGRVGQKTLERYSDILRLHLLPEFGKLRLSALRPAAIQRYYRKASESGSKARATTGGGLSPQTLLHHHRLLSLMLSTAVKWRVLERSPLLAVSPLRVPQQDQAVLTPEEVRELLLAVRGTRLWIPVLLAVTTGLRQGEIAALRWEDIDLETGWLVVRRSLSVTRAGVLEKLPKSGRQRSLWLSESVVVWLEEYRELLSALGPVLPGSPVIRTERSGSPVNPNTLSTSWRWFVAHHWRGRRVRFHDLRHTHATLLIKAGEDIKSVSSRLGHSRASVTLDIYAHSLPGGGREAARKTERVLRGEE